MASATEGGPWPEVILETRSPAARLGRVSVIFGPELAGTPMGSTPIGGRLDSVGSGRTEGLLAPRSWSVWDKSPLTQDLWLSQKLEDPEEEPNLRPNAGPARVNERDKRPRPLYADAGERV